MVEDAKQRTPTAQGTFGKTPFAHLLVYLLERQLTGTFELETPVGEQATVLVLEGQIAKVRLSEPVLYLSDVMLARGALTEAQHQGAVDALSLEQRLFGQIVLEKGMVDRDGLDVALRDQIAQKLVYIATWPKETTFAYFDAFDALADYGADDFATVDPLSVVWRAIDAAPSWEHANATLARASSAQLRIAANADVTRLAFDPEQMTLVDRIRSSPVSFTELVASSSVDLARVQLAVYCMLVTKQVELVAAQGPRVSGSPPVPSRSVAPEESRSVPPDAGSAPVGRMQLKRTEHSVPPGATEHHAPIVRLDGRLATPIGTVVAPKGLVPNVPPRASRPPMRLSFPPVEAAGSSEPIDQPIVAPPILAPAIPAAIAAPAISPKPLAPPQTTSPQAAAAPPGTVPFGFSPTSPKPPPVAAAPARPAAPAPAPAAPQELTPALKELRQKIIDRASSINKEDYFQMLGVSREADRDQIQAAYLSLAKTWHPDRLPKELADVKDKCTRVFAHLSEANQTLTDPERRTHYMTLLKDGGATPDDQAIITQVLEAATDFQKAEICMRRSDYAQAETLARKAHQADPKQAEYLALLAWLEAMKPDAQSLNATMAKVGMLTEAIKLSARCERAYFYRGMLYKRIKQDAPAMRDFKMAADLNPRNLDAVREVRLHTMRTQPGTGRTVPGIGKSPVAGKSMPPPGRGGSTPPSSRGSVPPPKPEDKGGLFGKLFKK